MWVALIATHSCPRSLGEERDCLQSTPRGTGDALFPCSFKNLLAFRCSRNYFQTCSQLLRFIIPKLVYVPLSLFPNPFSPVQINHDPLFPQTPFFGPFISRLENHDENLQFCSICFLFPCNSKADFSNCYLLCTSCKYSVNLRTLPGSKPPIRI